MTRARIIAACLASSERDMKLHAHRKSCAALTCGEPLTPGRIYCPNHWHFLPLWLRRAIINTFRDAEWDAHQEAISQASDFIDDAHLAARDAGFAQLVSAKHFANDRSRGKQVRFMGRAMP